MIFLYKAVKTASKGKLIIFYTKDPVKAAGLPGKVTACRVNKLSKYHGRRQNVKS